MGKWLKRIALALTGLGLFAFLAAYFGGRFAVQHYLAREWQAGPGTLRVYAPRFRWSLDLSADSARYRSPALDATVSGLRLSADLFGSLARFAPSARLRLDSVALRLGPGPARPDSGTAKPRPDSLPFAGFRIPGAALVRVGRLVVRDTAADSLAPLAEAEGVVARTRGERALDLKAAAVKARATGALVHRLRAAADWGGPDSVAVSLFWGRGKDSASCEARLAKANLLRLSARLRLHVASSRPYAQAFGLRTTLPRAEAVALEAELARGSGLAGRVRLDGRAAGLPQDLPVGLPDQAVSLRLDFDGRAGRWALRTRGGGTEGDLRGGLAFAGPAGGDSLADPAYLARHVRVTLAGRTRGFRAAVGGKSLPADLDVEDAVASPAAVKAVLRTGDGSRVELDLRRAAGIGTAPDRAPDGSAGSIDRPGGRARAKTGAVPLGRLARKAGRGSARLGNAQVTPSPLPGWEGEFSLDAAPRETWMLAFTDTNVAFAEARLAGRVHAGRVEATLEARALRAYGVAADSLRTALAYAGGTFALGPGRLWRNGTAWDAAGRAELGKAGPPASLRLAHAEAGSLEAAQAGPGRYEVHARDLAVDRLPYRGLDSLKAYRPRLTGDFAWDRNARSGSADLSAEGRYRQDPAAASFRAVWDAERLDVRAARASLGGNVLAASARIRLHGRQFYALKGLGPADVEDAALKAERFDLAKALAAFLPQPPLRAGRIDGDLGFAADRGFRGSCRATGLMLAGADRPFAIQEASLAGRGDTVLVRVATVSDAEPLFRDTVAAALTGLLGREQTLSLRARAGQDITLAFDGGLTGFRDLRGRLSARGGASLPGGAGTLRDARLAADVALPLKDGIKGLRLEADTLLATYVVPGLDTQAIAASVRMAGGKVEVPRLTLTGRDGAELRGRAEFDPDSRRLNADLSGERLSAQFGGDKIQLRALAARVEMDSAQAIVQAAVGSGSIEHVKSALRAAGDFSRLTAYYRAPLGEKADRPGGAIPLLRLSATLDSSNVRYRLRTSVEGLLNAFRRQGQRKAVARRAKPMQVDLNLETSGRGNSVETDVLRVTYVGNLSMVGTYPYALLRGRVTSITGGIGPKKQAYDIKGMEIKWLNAPLEEGELELNAEKRLARTCDPGAAADSCAIRMNLTGPLSDIKFAYDSDCRGGFGSGGADVTAMIFSVRRGCYSPSAATSAGGLTYQEQALGLLDPFASGYLTEKLGSLSGNWIQSAQITGIASLAQSRKASPADSARRPSGADVSEGVDQALGVEILSKEFWRVRFRAKSAYNLQYADQFNPWSYRVGVEWRAPVFRLVENPAWRNRLKDRVTVDASIYTDPSHSAQTENEDVLRRRLGLNYDYDWWGHWWGKAPKADSAAARRRAGSPDAAR
jgi:hypothetical protein